MMWLIRFTMALNWNPVDLNQNKIKISDKNISTGKSGSDAEMGLLKSVNEKSEGTLALVLHCLYTNVS